MTYSGTLIEDLIGTTERSMVAHTLGGDHVARCVTDDRPANGVCPSCQKCEQHCVCGNVNFLVERLMEVTR